MAILYEIIKTIFFAFTVLMSVFYLKSNIPSIQDSVSPQIQYYLMPWYMLFCGLMIWYLIANIWSDTQKDNTNQTWIYVKSFMIWTVIGIVLSLVYINI